MRDDERNSLATIELDGAGGSFELTFFPLFIFSPPFFRSASGQSPFNFFAVRANSDFFSFLPPPPDSKNLEKKRLCVSSASGEEQIHPHRFLSFFSLSSLP